MNATDVAIVAGRIVLFFAAGILAGRWIAPLLRWAARLGVSQGLLAATFVVAFIYAWAAEFVGAVAAITGSYLAGLLVAQTPFKAQVDDGIHPLTCSMFAPIFFISIGLHANGRELGDRVWFTLTLVLVAIVTKALGCFVFARLSGFSTSASIRVGAGMISRGEVGPIVAGYGLANGLIGRDVFSASVIMVLVSTMITPPLLRLTFPRPTRPDPHVAVEETIAGPPEEVDDAR